MSKKEKIILKAEDFHYPTKEEFQEINNFKPKFTCFSFDYKDPLTNFFNEDDIFGPKEINRINHLHWWNKILNNRISNLTRSYSRALVNFNRSIPETKEELKYENYINRIQFNFYCETYFYFYSTVQDTIWQILNVYYNIGSNEDKIYLNDVFISKINDGDVRDKIKHFRSMTSNVNSFRNKFTHRYPANLPDHRTSYIEENGQQILSAGLGNFTKSSDLANQIKTSLEKLAAFITDLCKLMP